MSGLVELARYPELKLVTVSSTGQAGVQSVLLPVDCMGFVIYCATAGAAAYWAVEEGQAHSSTGRRRTVPAGETGGATGMKLKKNETLYLSSDTSGAKIEIEIYTRA